MGNEFDLVKVEGLVGCCDEVNAFGWFWEVGSLFVGEAAILLGDNKLLIVGCFDNVGFLCEAIRASLAAFAHSSGDEFVRFLQREKERLTSLC